jgi:hypothetical protein
VPSPYQIWLRQPCLDYLATLLPQARNHLISWIEAIGTDVTKAGDFTTTGTDGRNWQVAILGHHAVVWWVDDAVCEVKVVAIRPADR